VRQWVAREEALLEWLYASSQAERWTLSKESFMEALTRSAEHRFSGSRPAADEIEAYLRSLHLKDLALACACAEGQEAAWVHFFRTYRNYLHAAAAAIAGWSSRDPRACELADALYAELYGACRGMERRSLLVYFHGRSKLETWLRAVLAQRHVDGVRAAKRLEPLDDATGDAPATPFVRGRNDPPNDPHRERYLALLRGALDGALAALDARDRTRLSLYYAEGQTLAQIGRQLSEHEGTVSRNLERIRRELRGKVEGLLRAGKPGADGSGGQHGLAEEQIELCFEYALDDWPFDLREALDRSEPPDLKERRS
jgi:RNA polymerase sigma-70 factor